MRTLREEYEEVCRKYYNRTYLFLLKLCNDPELAEDLTQDTFYQTILSLHRFSGNSDMFTYIASIAKHTYYKHIRKNKPAESCVSLSELADKIADSDDHDPLSLIEKAGETVALRELVERLPEKYRAVVQYRIYADMSFSQTAKALGISENSAKVIFYRAKKKLTEELKNGYIL
ncbi:MAG: sigma-70 family RNA polymerase sigma factor [Clostridia bacterium]|nr:sigma-70 family RNA polymerase sigma factor [Clostridia bacterium]